MICIKYLIVYYNNDTRTVHNAIEYGSDKHDIIISFNKKHHNSAILNLIEL